MSLFRRLVHDASGATSIEYALIAGIVSIVIVSALQTIGPELTGTFSKVSAKLQAANN